MTNKQKIKKLKRDREDVLLNPEVTDGHPVLKLIDDWIEKLQREIAKASEPESDSRICKWISEGRIHC